MAGHHHASQIVGKEVLVPETTMPDVRATDPVAVGEEVSLPDHETVAGVSDTPDIRLIRGKARVEDTKVFQFLLSLIVRNKVLLRIR